MVQVEETKVSKANLSQFVAVHEVEKKALELLPKTIRDYYQSGADDEETLKRNKAAFKKYLIRPLVLVDVSRLETQTKIKFSDKLTYTFQYPLGIAPTAFQRMAHPEGELAICRAAGESRTLMICSSLSTTRIEEIAENSLPGTNLWFQLYVYKDRKVTENLVKRAIASGYKALVLTVDAPTMGRRRADEKNGFELPPHLKMANFDSDEFQKTYKGEPGKSGFGSYVMNLFDLTLDWRALRWLVDFSSIPVIVKGIMRGSDALKALEAGAKGIVVSNHGGRQLDHAPATIEVLPEVVRAVNGKCPVFVDGGVRSGTDIYKAIALGADMVFVGRPVIYGLTVGGSEGVKHVINILRNEFEFAMRLAGTPSVSAMRGNDMIVREEHYSKL
ncbi:hypothetical protein FO519_006396 [Halicephalobus sp. NKZ332]|nr:hypothetical protein FO519_006396 [Halicephalobus sp. NKZ332]